MNSIIAGTTDGRLFLVENGELKAVYNVYTLLDFDLCKAMKNPLETRPLSGIPKMKIRLCLPIKSGLMLVINSYCVYYYKITKDWRSVVYGIVLCYVLSVVWYCSLNETDKFLLFFHKIRENITCSYIKSSRFFPRLTLSTTIIPVLRLRKAESFTSCTLTSIVFVSHQIPSIPRSFF